MRAAWAGGGRLIADYRATWRATGTAGRRFLIGGVFYSLRLVAFLVAFPLYARSRGYDTGDIGLALAGLWLSLVVIGIPVTWLGSRGHGRRLLATGPLLAAGGQALIVLAPDGALTLTFAGTLLVGMAGTTFWILGDPLLVATTSAQRRAHLFALKFALITAASALGGGLGGWIPALLATTPWLTDLGALTATMILLALMDGIQVALFWSMPATPPLSAAAAAGAPAAAAVDPQRGERSIWLILLVITAPEIGMAIGHNSIRPFLSLFLTDEQGLSAALTGTVIAGMSAVGGLAVLLLPAIAGRFGNLGTIAAFRLAAAGAVALCVSGVGVVAVVALLCAYYGTIDGTEGTYVTEAMDRLPVARRTAFSGLYAILWSAASAIASTVSGRLQDRPHAGFVVAFGLGALGYLLSAVWIGTTFPRLPRLVPVHSGSGAVVAGPASVVDELAAAGE